MVRNYLKGVVGDAINVILSAAAMNFKRIMNIIQNEEGSFVPIFSRLILFCLHFFLSPKNENYFLRIY